jgi:hypothetical protein
MLDRGEVDAAQIEEVEAICRTTSDPDAKATPDAVQGQLAAAGPSGRGVGAYLRAPSRLRGRWGQLRGRLRRALDDDRIGASGSREAEGGRTQVDWSRRSRAVLVNLDALQGRVTEA